MIQLIRRVLIGAAALLIVAPNFALADLRDIEAAAKKEGNFTWYVASIDSKNAEKAGRAFTAKYGIKVDVVRAASQIMYQRLQQDLSQNTGNADVFSSVDLGNFVELKKTGSLLAYRPEAAAQIDPAFRDLDPENFFQATIASVIIIAYNHEKVKPEDAPKSWSDLLDTKWKGKIAFGHPAYSGFAGNWAAQMMKLYGKAYFEKLEMQHPLVGRSLFDAINLVSSGERLVTASPIAPVLESTDKGNPLTVVYPTEGAILVLTPSGIVKNSPHPNAARLFMEFMLGPEFSKILAEAHYETMRSDVKPLPGAKPVSEVKIIRPTIDDTTVGIPAVSELWRNVFGQ
jgi:iron(III) transport system substrate-binding protein